VSNRRGSNTGERYWEEEGIAGRGMTGGSGLSERGRGVGLGRLGAGWAGWSPGVGPVGLLASSFIIFSSAFLFSFILNFCFEF
jgi:hypothetical protein